MHDPECVPGPVLGGATAAAHTGRASVSPVGSPSEPPGGGPSLPPHSSRGRRPAGCKPHGCVLCKGWKPEVQSSVGRAGSLLEVSWKNPCPAFSSRAPGTLPTFLCPVSHPLLPTPIQSGPCDRWVITASQGPLGHLGSVAVCAGVLIMVALGRRVAGWGGAHDQAPLKAPPSTPRVTLGGGALYLAPRRRGGGRKGRLAARPGAEEPQVQKVLCLVSRAGHAAGSKC